MDVDELLLTRLHRVVVPEATGFAGEHLLQALDVELAALGYVLAYRLRRALGRLDPAGLGAARDRLTRALLKARGGDVRHEPLFRRFPQDVPRDTTELWWRKFVGFYLQDVDQPCLWCDGRGQTHVLSCGHVACDRCFDGSSYAGCPVCERHVDRSSPFFQPSPSPGPAEAAPIRAFTLIRLDLAGDRDDEARALLRQLCARVQPMTPDDVDALKTIVHHAGTRALGWLPDDIPVRENVAHAFAVVMKVLGPVRGLAAARPRLSTATDVLRLLAAFSGADPSLQPTAKLVPLVAEQRARWSGNPRRWLDNPRRKYAVAATVTQRQWKVAPLPRPLRRDVLALLDAMPADSLAEDVLRHASAWQHVARMLHVGEHADRFPNAARALALTRGHGEFSGFAATAERLRESGDVPGLVRHLATRPGELVRRADDTLRRATSDADRRLVADTLASVLPEAATPALIGLLGSVRLRTSPWPVRVFFPKGAAFEAPASADVREPLPDGAARDVARAVERELLRRYEARPRVDVAIVDRALADVVAPFVQRSAARSAVSLPRGSRVDVPPSSHLRLFLHWCQPEGGEATDVDLSVAFYRDDWSFGDVCSFYQLRTGADAAVAKHSGDWRDAPWPDGASEFVDVDRAAAHAAGFRYAVMVVALYDGMKLSRLDRSFAGVMVGDAPPAGAFDPRAVRLRFDVQGEHGVFVPLVVDLAETRLWWLDAALRGSPFGNSVARSNRSLERIGKDVLAYFGHGARLSMFELARLHAAARADVVHERAGDVVYTWRRRPGEGSVDFLDRLRTAPDDEGSLRTLLASTTGPVFAALATGDVAVPAGSEVYTLFPADVTGNVAAADLLG